MTADTTDGRRLLPRWRPWQAALLAKEMSPQSPQSSPERFEPAFRRALTEWRLQPTQSRSSEVLAAALHFDEDSDLVRQIASQVRDGRVNSHLRGLAISVLQRQNSEHRGGPAHAYGGDLGDDSTSYDYETAGSLSVDVGQWTDPNVIAAATVRELRAKVRQWPRNPFTWMDLARAYFTLGYESKAQRSIEVALSLDPDNRFIVRSATRYLVHVGSEDIARAVISNASGVEDDPWMFAASAAVSSSRRNGLRQGLRLIESGSFAPWHLSELSATLASREDESGQARMAKQFMRRALVDPTENVLAHAEWATHLGELQLPRTTRDVSPPFEALARRTARRLEWSSAADHAWRWHLEEPFSDQASGTGSCYALYAHRYDQAIAMTSNGLRSNPRDATLLNNRAFALACTWKLDRAAQDLGAIDRTTADANTLACAAATAGFLAFRIGEPELGRGLYGGAIRSFTRRREAELAARASVNLASEELRIGSEMAPKAVLRADDLVAHCQSAEVADSWSEVRVGKFFGQKSPEYPRSDPGLAIYALELKDKFDVDDQ
jgi:tetratricopeptide (TPR) repeat protein